VCHRRTRHLALHQLIHSSRQRLAGKISPASQYHRINVQRQWIYYLTIMFLGLQLLLFVFFLPETQYIPDPHNPSAGRTGVKYWPWQRPRDYLALTLRPIVISRFVALTVPAFYYGIVFGLSVGISVLVPGRLFVSMYGFSTQAVGIAYVVPNAGEGSRRSFSGRYLAFAVGGVLGKTAGGWVGDRTVLWIQARTGERHPEYRIWAMVSAVNDLNRCQMLISGQIPLLPVLLAGFLVFGLALEHELHWMVVLVGVALDYMGLAGITGILSTYMIESYLLEPMNAMAYVACPVLPRDSCADSLCTASSNSGSASGVSSPRSSCSSGAWARPGGPSTSPRRSSSSGWASFSVQASSSTASGSGARRACQVRTTCDEKKRCINEDLVLLRMPLLSPLALAAAYPAETLAPYDPIICSMAPCCTTAG
jgi:hypothetical protein